MAFATKTELDSLVEVNIPNNNQRLVTEPKVRTVMKAVIERMFQFPQWKIGVAPGPLKLDVNYNLNYELSPIVLRKPGGGVELFTHIIDAMAVANNGDLIEVNAPVILIGSGSQIILKNGVNIDFRYHSIYTNDVSVIFDVSSNNINCALYNIDSINHEYYGLTDTYGSIKDLNVLKCTGSNCHIKISCKKIIVNLAGIVNLSDCLKSVVEINFDKIQIFGEGVKLEATFYLESNLGVNSGRNQLLKNRLELKGNVIECFSEILFTAMYNCLIRVDVRYIKIEGAGLLLSIGRGIVEFMDMHAISDSFCLIRDKDWDLTDRVGLVSFSGKNFLQCFGTNGAFNAHSVITLYGRFCLIENYGALRIEQKNPVVFSEGCIKQDLSLFNFYGIPYQYGYSQVVNAGTMLLNCVPAYQNLNIIKGNAANLQVNTYLM